MIPTVRPDSLCFNMQTVKRYILQPEGLKVGDSVLSGPQAEIKIELSGFVGYAGRYCGIILNFIEDAAVRWRLQALLHSLWQRRRLCDN